MIYKDIVIVLVTCICLYIFYKGVKEKNILKITFPLILFIINMLDQVKNIICLILLLLYFIAVWILPYLLCIMVYLIDKEEK